jgi:hypothetical protein
MAIHKKIHSFTGTTDHDFTGLISGQLIQYDGSGIVSAGAIPTSGDLWSASTGANSIIANNGSGNLAAGDYSIVGGKQNIANWEFSVVLGGSGNTASAGYSNYTSTIGGGISNQAIGYYGSTVSGGKNNTASGSGSFIGGGENNTASDYYSTVGGGKNNTASGQQSFVGGGINNTALGLDSAIVGGNNNLASGTRSFVGGGISNSGTSSYSSISGGKNNLASGTHSFVGGGTNGVSSGSYSSVVGGYYATASGLQSFIGGGYRCVASGDYSSIIGGQFNSAITMSSVVIGGQGNLASGIHSSIIGGKGNIVTGYYSIVGGYNNRELGGGYGSAVIGGRENLSTFGYASVFGGGFNTASTGSYATVFAGTNNHAQGDRSAIMGGFSNSILDTGGQSDSVILGGKYNEVSGIRSSIIGGSGNTVAGNYSIILGGSGMTNSFDSTLMTQNARLAENGGVVYSAGTDLYDILIQGLQSVLNEGSTGSVTTDITMTRSNGSKFTRLLLQDAGAVFGQQEAFSAATFQGVLNTNTKMTFSKGPASTKSITFDGSNMTILDSMSSIGLVYSANYHPNYTSRSLIDKEYVDNIISTGVTIVTASNGLTKTGDNITLGGTLTAATTINAGGNGFSINNVDVLEFQSGDNTNIYAGQDVVLSGGVNTQIYGNSGISLNDNTTLTGYLDASGGISGNTVHADTFFSMVPYTGSNPSSPNNNDIWFHSGVTGTITLNYRVGGSNFSVELAQ